MIDYLAHARKVAKVAAPAKQKETKAEKKPAKDKKEPKQKETKAEA